MGVMRAVGQVRGILEPQGGRDFPYDSPGRTHGHALHVLRG